MLSSTGQIRIPSTTPPTTTPPPTIYQNAKTITILIVIKCVIFKLFKIKRDLLNYNFGDIERGCIWVAKAYIIYWINLLFLDNINNTHPSTDRKKWVILYMLFSLFFILWRTGLMFNSPLAVTELLVLDEATIGLLYIGLFVDYLGQYGKNDIRTLINV